MTVASADPMPAAAESPRSSAGEARSISRAQSARHVLALDGIRGFAILGVLFAHLFGGEWRNIAVLDQVCRFLAMGWIGVDLFFVLSGYLITGILIDARENPLYFRNFYGRRAIRIFPLYYGILIFGLLAGQLHHGQIWLWTYLVNFQIASANTMLVPATGWLKLAQFWSLAVEEHFYFVWPLVVFYCSPRRLLRVAIILAAASLMARSIFVFETGRAVAPYVLTPFRLDGLLIGAACAIAMRNETLRVMLSRAAMPSLAVATTLVAAAYVLTDWNQYSVFATTVGYTILALAFATFIIATLTRGADHWLRKLTELRILRFFGKYSYGMYAYHTTLFPLILFPVAKALLPLVHSQTIASLLAKPVALAAVVVLALASWHLYEKHWLKLRKYFVGK